jgi:hypothetical protein
MNRKMIIGWRKTIRMWLRENGAVMIAGMEEKR